MKKLKLFATYCRRLDVVVLVFVYLAMLSYFIEDSQLWASNEAIFNDVYHNSSINANSSNTLGLNITFSSLQFNNDHDIISSGEWMMSTYINDRRIDLLNESAKVETGDILKLSNKTIIYTIPINKTINLVTVGIESDTAKSEKLPDISGLLNNSQSFEEYKDKAISMLQQFIVFDRNDAIGFIAKEYSKDNNFGIGLHEYCSESSGEGSDLFDTVDTSCDFRLIYSIQESNK